MSTKFIHNRIVTLGLAGAIVAGVIGAGGVALAANGGTGAPALQQSASLTSQTAKPHEGRHGVLKGLFADIVKQSGLTRADLKAGFKAGQSIDEMITAKGGNPATVKTAVLNDVATRLSTAVANKKVTQAQAEKVTAKAPAAVDRIMALKGGPARHALALAREFRKTVIKTTATTLNIDVKTLRQDLKNGQTIAQVAGAQTGTVITAIDAKVDAAINQAVTNGKIKSERAEALKTKVHERVANFVNSGPKHKATTTTPSTTN